MTPRGICLVVQKASPGPYWGKLLKGAGKPPHYVRVDWSKYKDEDEEAESAGAARSSLPRSQPPVVVRASCAAPCSLRAPRACATHTRAASSRIAAARALAPPARDARGRRRLWR